jgi:hypothetical protein
MDLSGGWDRADLRWPDLGAGVLAEMCRHPGRVALIESNEGAGEAAARLAALADQQPLRVGAALAANPDAISEQSIVELLSPSLVLTDIDALFWRLRFGLDVLRLLRVIARRRSGAVVVWPGVIGDGEAQYSQPGRVDYYRQALNDALVLAPLQTTFDDDPPFEIKRLP